MSVGYFFGVLSHFLLFHLSGPADRTLTPGLSGILHHFLSRCHVNRGLANQQKCGTGGKNIGYTVILVLHNTGDLCMHQATYIEITVEAATRPFNHSVSLSQRHTFF